MLVLPAHAFHRDAPGQPARKIVGVVMLTDGRDGDTPVAHYVLERADTGLPEYVPVSDVTVGARDGVRPSGYAALGNGPVMFAGSRVTAARASGPGY